ncbi:MAG: chemotaxis protein CheX [Planctomycetota bacterium]
MNAAQPDAGITTKIINPLLAAVSETFDMMLGCPVEREQLALRAFEAELYDLSAVIGITGSAKGAICISFPANTALSLVDAFIGEKSSRITPSVVDAMGELVNIVAGATKSKMKLGLNMGLPNVVHGKRHKVDLPTDSKPMRVSYSSALGPFLVDFGFVVRVV